MCVGGGRGGQGNEKPKHTSTNVFHETNEKAVNTCIERFGPKQFNFDGMHAKRARATINEATLPRGSCGEEKEEAGKRLRTRLITMHIKKEMSAKDVCLIAYGITEAGGVGLSDLAMGPTRCNDSNFAQHLKLILGREFQDNDLYYAEVPLVLKKGCARERVSIPFNLPTESTFEFLNLDLETMSDDWTTPIGEAGEEEISLEYSEAYREHPVVQRGLAAGYHRSRIRPGSLYWDGVRYTKNDNFEGVFYQDLLSGHRTLIVVLRSTDFCQCGCKGWCTWFAIHHVIASDLKNGAAGLFMVTRHEGKPFNTTTDRLRASRVGRSLGFLQPMSELRADWPALAKPFPSQHIQVLLCVGCCVWLLSAGDIGQPTHA